MMSNLSAESFPDDSIIHNISLHPPLPGAISADASGDTGPAFAQLQQPIASTTTIARPPLSMRSQLLQKTASIPPSDFELELLNNVATLNIFDSLSNKARSLSPESLCDRSTSTTTSTASTSGRSTSGASSSSSTKYTKSATAIASSGSNASGSSSGSVSTSTGGVSRRIGSAFKQQHGAGSNGGTGGSGSSAPMLLSKKSASVDSLHHPGGGDKSLQPRRTQRYDHVRSKVKEYIDTQREEDQRRRMATKFQRHRSMPESLCDPSSATATSAQQDAEPDALGELRDSLRHKDAQLAEMEQTIRSLTLCYEVSMRDHDDKLRLERKVEVMRLELLQANNERLHYQDELQLLLKKQQAASSSASSSASAASSTVSTNGSGSYRLPVPISLLHGPRNGSVSYGESSVGSASSSSSTAEFAVVESAMSTGNGGGGGGVGGGLHLRPSAAAAAAATADKASPSGRRGANMSSSSTHSMRQIIGHSDNSDYRLLSSGQHDDHATGDAADDDSDDADIALFDQAARGGPIISSSSMSHEDRLSDVANAGFAMSPGQGGSRYGSRRGGGGRRRRMARAIRKRLRRMLGKCGACLDRSGRDDSGSDRYDSMADISLLYTGLNGQEEGDESTATATTGYNSFS